MEFLIDAHCVIVEDIPITQDENCNCLVVGTKRNDWDSVLKSLCCQRAIGLHPWYLSPDSSSNDISILKDLLITHPDLRVGEIGLDKTISRKVDFDFQKQVFNKQLELAIELKRSVSIHCVRAHGTLLSILQEKENKVNKPLIGIYLHSWSGSEDITKQLLRLKNIGKQLYFGISIKINSRHPKLIEFLPKDKILIESDLFFNDPERISSLKQALILAKLSEDQVKENFIRFLKLMEKGEEEDG